MATLTVSVPDATKDWIEDLARRGEIPDSGDYLADLVRRDRERRGETLSLDDLRAIVADARRNGVSGRSHAEIFAEAEAIVKHRQAGG